MERLECICRAAYCVTADICGEIVDKNLAYSELDKPIWENSIKMLSKYLLCAILILIAILYF